LKPYTFVNLDTREAGQLEVLFPGWDGANERLCVYSPHDDDALLGAGYAIRAAVEAGAEVTIMIVCSGNAGYSSPEQRDTIVETRRRETRNCYRALGVREENIIFLGFPDFSAIQYVGWQIAPDREGHFRRTITELRTRGITRILVPNHYHEHIDHLAASLMASYDAPQSGDAFAVDWAAPHAVRSVAQYAVWADLAPEDAVLRGRDTRLRANTAVMADESVEETIREGVRKYVSQQQIIADLIAQRQARRMDDGRYVEVYLRFDPRPKLSYAPYKDFLSKLPY
jgi:LmbE family N-acetylglucosaminyl deacetylase